LPIGEPKEFPQHQQTGNGNVAVDEGVPPLGRGIRVQPLAEGFFIEPQGDGSPLDEGLVVVVK